MRKILSCLVILLLGIPAFSQKTAVENALVDAVAQINGGDTAGAAKKLMMLHAADSTNDAVLYYLAVCEIEQKDYKSATEHLEKAVALDGSNSWYRNALAGLYYDNGEDAKAIPLLKDLVKENPAYYQNSYVLCMLGDAMMQERNDSLALDYFEKALAVDPGNAHAQIGKAQAHDGMGNRAAFFHSFKEFLGNDTVKPEAKAYYVKAVLDGLTPQFYWIWGKEVHSLVDTCVVQHPDCIDIQELRLTSSFIKQDTTDILDCCMDIARLAAEQGKPKKAAEAWGNFGDMMHEMDEEALCFKAYQTALKFDPTYCPTLNNYAYYLSLKGKKLRKALKMSAVTVEAEPDNATYLDTYAWILHLLGRDDEAKPVLKHAMIYGGRESQAVLEHYSEVLRALGENDLADYYRQLAEKR